MLTLAHLHQLFSIETCQTYLHALRWKDRPLQCPRCHSHDVDPWGNYHYRPGCKRYWCNGCGSCWIPGSWIPCIGLKYLILNGFFQRCYIGRAPRGKPVKTTCYAKFDQLLTVRLFLLE